MPITDLNQYYQSIGKPLPSISSRAGLYSQYGLGSNYIGSASQNTALLQKLLAGGTPGSTPAAPSAPAAPTGPTLPMTGITDASVAQAQAKAADLFAPEKAALGTDLTAKLKESLAASDTQARTDLASRGFLRSGEEISRNDLARTVAESDLALQEAGYMSDIQSRQDAYASNLIQQAAGISQQEFNNMQTELGRQLQVTDAQTALLTNPDFATMMNSIGQNPQYQQIIVKMLQGLGFNVTL